MLNTLRQFLPGPGKPLNTRKKIEVIPTNGKSFPARFVQVNGNNAKMLRLDTGEIVSVSLNTSAKRSNFVAAAP